MKPAVAHDLESDNHEREQHPTLGLVPADANRREPGAYSLDATQGRQIGANPYEDATQGRQIGSRPGADATAAR